MLPFFHGLKVTTGLASIFSAVFAEPSNNPFNSVQIVDIVNKRQRKFTQRANARVIRRYSSSAAVHTTTITESKDKTMVVVGYGSKVSVLNKITGQVIRDFELAGFIPRTNLRGAEPKLSGDNLELFVALDAAPWYQIFDMTTGFDISSQLEAAYRPTQRIAAFDYSQNGQVMAIAHTDSKGLAIYYVGPLVPPGFDPYDFGDIQPPATGGLPQEADCAFANNNEYFCLSSAAPNALRVYNVVGWTLTKTVQPEALWSALGVALSEDSTRIAIGRNGATGANAIYLTGPLIGAAVEGITASSTQMIAAVNAGKNCLKFCQNDTMLGYTRNNGGIGFVSLSSGFPVQATTTDPGASSNYFVNSFIEGSGGLFHCAYGTQSSGNSFASGFREFEYNVGESPFYFYNQDMFSPRGFRGRFISLSNDKTRAIYPLRKPGGLQRFISMNTETGAILSVFVNPLSSAPDIGQDGSSIEWNSIKISPNNQHCVGKFLQSAVGAEVRSVNDLNSVLTAIPLPSFITDTNSYRNSQYTTDGNFLVVSWGGANNSPQSTQIGISIHDVNNNYAVVNEIFTPNFAPVYFELSNLNNDILVTMADGGLGQIRLYNISGALLHQVTDKRPDALGSFIEGGSSFAYYRSDFTGRKVSASSPFNQIAYNNTVASNLLAEASTTFSLSQIDPLNRYIGTVAEIYDSLNLGLLNLRTVSVNNPQGLTGAIIETGSMRG